MQYPKLYATNNHELSVIKWNCEAIALYVEVAIVSSMLARKTPMWSFYQLIQVLSVGQTKYPFRATGRVPRNVT